MRANIDRDTASLLRAAGCDFAFVGVESLSDETLALMKKRRTEAQNITALRNFLEAGFRRVVAGFIPGFPGDTRDRFFRTALALREIHQEYPDSFRVNVEPFFLAPGQPMFKQLESCGLQPHKWAEEYLAIAPAYREITGEIYCRVDGSNQGLDRLGELTIAQVVTEEEEEEVVEELLYYSDPAELPVDRLRIEPLQNYGYFGRLKTEAAQIYGVILSSQELADYNLLESKGRMRGPTGLPVPLLRRKGLAEFLRNIENLHAVPPRNGSAKIVRDSYSPKFLVGSSLMLSPFVVARRVKIRSSDRILLVNLTNLAEFSLDPEWEAVLSFVAKKPASQSRLQAMLLQEKPSMTDRLTELLEHGMLFACNKESRLTTS